jgi:hypothetical protein
MTAALLICVSGAAFWLLRLLKSTLDPVIVAELRGAFDDHLKAHVHRAVAKLPTAIAGQFETEWLGEVAALGDRRWAAWCYARGLSEAASVIAEGLEGAPSAGKEVADSEPPSTDPSARRAHAAVGAITIP